MKLNQVLLAIVSLIIATMLWLQVQSQGEPFTQREIAVRLEIRNIVAIDGRLERVPSPVELRETLKALIRGKPPNPRGGRRLKRGTPAGYRSGAMDGQASRRAQLDAIVGHSARRFAQIGEGENLTRI